jgi:hypothetical protein
MAEGAIAASRVIAWLGQAVAVVGVAGAVLTIDTNRPVPGLLLTFFGLAWLWPTRSWWRWLTAPAKQLTGIQVHAPATPIAQVGTAASLLADAQHRQAVRNENDAAAELQSRWRCAQVQIMAGAAGVGTMVPTLFVIMNASVMSMLSRYQEWTAVGMVLAGGAWGFLVFAGLAWVAVLRSWGMLPCMIVCAATAVVLSLALSALALHGHLGFSMLVIAFTVMLALAGGWILGLLVESTDRATAQRIT